MNLKREPLRCQMWPASCTPRTPATATSPRSRRCFAGAAGSEDLAAGMRECFRPWVAVVEDGLAQVMRDSPLSGAVGVRHLAFLVSAMFLGIELMTFVDADDGADAEVFDAMDEMSALIEELLTLGPVASRVVQRRLGRR